MCSYMEISKHRASPISELLSYNQNETNSSESGLFLGLQADRRDWNSKVTFLSMKNPCAVGKLVPFSKAPTSLLRQYPPMKDMVPDLIKRRRRGVSTVWFGDNFLRRSPCRCTAVFYFYYDFLSVTPNNNFFSRNSPLQQRGNRRCALSL